LTVTQEDLVGLRLDLQYTAQKVERRVIASLSAKHREKHTEHYTQEEIATAKKEVAVADQTLRACAEHLLPVLNALVQEAASV
jgi:hypothetical protein